MVAAPQMATATFVGDSGQHYSKDVYCSDVAASPTNWPSGGVAAATTTDHWTPPEGVRLVDFSILTGMTDTTALQPTRNGVATGDILRFANHLNTLNSRPIPNIPFAALTEIGFNQLA